MVASSIKPTVAMLSEIKLLKSFSEDDLNSLIKLGTTATYEAHTNVIIEGELSWGLYLILEGMVGILKNNKLTGDTYDVGQLRAGSFFGEMSLIDENPRSATVRTLTSCELFYISKDAFLNFLSKSPDIQLRFYQNTVRNLVVRLRELDDNFVISQYQLWHTALKKEESGK